MWLPFLPTRLVYQSHPFVDTPDNAITVVLSLNEPMSESNPKTFTIGPFTGATIPPGQQAASQASPGQLVNIPITTMYMVAPWCNVDSEANSVSWDPATSSIVATLCPMLDDQTNEPVVPPSLVMYGFTFQVQNPSTDQDSPAISILTTGQDGSELLRNFAIQKPSTEDRKSTRLNSSHSQQSRMPSSA